MGRFVSRSVRKVRRFVSRTIRKLTRMDLADAVDCRYEIHIIEVAMKTSELEATLGRLETLAPSSRLSEKRQLLAGARERILALRQRGHSWRSLANELSIAIGETVSADLLRAACTKRARRRVVHELTSSTTAAKVVGKDAPVAPPPTPNSDRFGAKGMKL